MTSARTAFFTALLALASAPHPLNATPTPKEEVAYTLAPVIKDGTLESLQVEIRFRADASGTTTLDLPDHWAGRKELWRNLRDIAVEGALSVGTPDAAHRRIVSKPGAPLLVRYRVVSAIDHEPTQDDEQPFAPWVRPSWFYATGEAVFAAPHDRVSVPARFDWIGAPKTFVFASDLEHLAGVARPASRPGVVGDIQESVMLGGTDVKIFTRQDRGAPVRVAMRGDYGFSDSQFFDLAEKIISGERDFWNAKGSPFLITLAPLITPPGASSLGGTGRTDAFELTVSPSSPLDKIRFLLAHEYFHTWNVRQLGGAIEGPDEPLGYWFSEGFTDFYARRLLVRYGLFTPQDFANDWNQMLAAYANSSVRTAPNSRIKSDFWKDYAVEKLPYQRGALLAAIWDARLRTMSGGKTNLDDVLRAQNVAVARLKPGASPKPRAAELFPTIAARFGLNVQSDLDRFVERGEPILLPADVFGPCMSVNTVTRPVFDYGFDVQATAKAGNIVAGLRPGAPAYAAGLRDGMKLLKRVAGEPGNSSVAYVIKVKDGNAEREIRFRPEGLTSVTVQIVSAKPDADPSACTHSLGGLPS